MCHTFVAFIAFSRDVAEETIPDGSQRSDGLSDDVADVPILIGNPNEEVKVGECLI